jgi:signal transduction histidine kinase
MLTLTVAVYGGIEAGFRVADRPPSIGVRGLVVALIAAGFHPVMVRVRAIMDELLFGGRADPVDTMSRLGTQLTAGSAPQAWMDTLRVALAVPGVVLRRGGEVIAASGDVDGARTAVTPLRTGAEDVGELVVSLPTDQIRLTPATQAVLALVAAPLAQALHATRLGEQLKASRGRLVSALEDERRRIRRDLHDGLGPTLTGIAYSADAAANLVRVDGGQAIQVLRELRSDAGEAIAEVRRIVDGLRPRALDELGLVGAVQQRVSHVRAADGEVMAVDVTAPDDLPELPAAVEVAAYRVAVEAVTNVARHARVSAATVEFSVHEGPTLRVVICDRGRSGNPWRPGVGLASMRERVEQIGGELTVRNGDLGATITAHLPLTLPAAD